MKRGADMTKSTKVVFLFLFFVFCFFNRAESIIRNKVDIKSLISGSDVVCLATVKNTALLNNDEKLGAIYESELEIHHVYKGEIVSGSKVISYRIPMSDIINLSAGTYLLFLKKGEDDKYTPFLTYDYFRRVPDDITTNGGYEDIYDVEKYVINSDYVQYFILAMRTVDDMISLRGSDTAADIIPLLNTTNENAKGLALNALFIMGKYDYLEETEKYIEDKHEDKAADFYKDTLLTSIRATKDPKLLSFVTKFAESSDERMRYVGWHALSNIGNADSVKYLIDCVSDESAKQLRSACHYGLVRITNIDALDNYVSNQASGDSYDIYGEAWNSWWVKEGEQLYK